MNLETIQLSPTAMGYINWNDGNAIASVCLDVYATPDDIEQRHTLICVDGDTAYYL